MEEYNTWNDIMLDSLEKETARMRSFKFKGKIVRHFKGNKYLVLGFARHTETGELMAIYKKTAHY
mgnify:FL=1